MSTTNPTLPVRREPPWWVVLFAIPFVLSAVLFAGAGALAGLSWIDGVTAGRETSSSLPIDAGGAVSITATDAAVTVEAGPEGQVSVDDWMQVRGATRSSARSALDAFSASTIGADPRGVAVQVPSDRFIWGVFELQRRVTVRVPPAAAVNVRGSAGALDVRGLSGPLDLNVASGAIRLRDVVVTGSDRVAASAGAVAFDGSLAGGDLDIETNAGAIQVTLPRGTDATYDAATTTGAILIRPESGFPSARRGPDASARGVLGGGGSSNVRLRANTGAISLTVR